MGGVDVLDVSVLEVGRGAGVDGAVGRQGGPDRRRRRLSLGLQTVGPEDVVLLGRLRLGRRGQPRVNGGRWQGGGGELEDEASTLDI